MSLEEGAKMKSENSLKKWVESGLSAWTLWVFQNPVLKSKSFKLRNLKVGWFLPDISTFIQTYDVYPNYAILLTCISENWTESLIVMIPDLASLSTLYAWSITGCSSDALEQAS